MTLSKNVGKAQLSKIFSAYLFARFPPDYKFIEKTVSVSYKSELGMH